MGNAAFADGSGLAGSISELRRCGWAIVQLSQQGLPIRAAFGALPGPLQTVCRAEVYAVLFALQHADLAGQGVLLLVHNEAIVGGLRRLRSAAAASEPGEASDLWRQIAQIATPSLHK